MAIKPSFLVCFFCFFEWRNSRERNKRSTRTYICSRCEPKAAKVCRSREITSTRSRGYVIRGRVNLASSSPYPRPPARTGIKAERSRAHASRYLPQARNWSCSRNNAPKWQVNTLYANREPVTALRTYTMCPSDGMGFAFSPQRDEI